MTSPDHLKGCNPGNRTDQRPTFSFSEDISNTHHKTTSSWALHVSDQGMGWSVGGGAMGSVIQMRDAYLATCTAKLVDRHPLTSWEQARLQAKACYEADRRRMKTHRDTDGRFKEANGRIPSGSWGVQQTERGVGHGSTGDQQVEESADDITTALETPLKRQRLREVTGITQQEETRGEEGSVPWANRREVLTIFRGQMPAFLDVAEVIRLIGTPLTMLVGTMKHMTKRAVPVKAWATEIEVITVPTITNVLEASWKWDGQSEQPQWEPDSDRFTQLFPTYQAWHTLAYKPQVLTQMAALPPEHRVFTDLGERIRANMCIGWLPASYGPIPNGPSPSMEANKAGSVQRWYLHTLAEAALCGAPHDVRLQKALRQELQGVFDQHQMILWIGTEWPSEGCMESVRVQTGGAPGQQVNVWL